MRKLYWVIKIISALVGLVFLANMTVPNWRDLAGEGIGNAIHWVSQQSPQAVKWGTDTYNKIQTQAQNGGLGPSPSASPAPGSHSKRPTPSPITLVLTTPSPKVAQPAAAEQGPPPATPLAPADQAAWSGDVCHTMIEDMSWDSNLDHTTAVQNQGTNPAQSAYYATWSAHWQTVVDDMNAGPCAYTPAPLTGAQCTDPQSWFPTAIDGHAADEQAKPQNKSWDDQWIAIYQQLANLWGYAGC